MGNGGIRIGCKWDYQREVDVDFTATLVERAKAVLMKTVEGKTHWIPRSLILDSQKVDGVVRLRLPFRFAQREGLVHG